MKAFKTLLSILFIISFVNGNYSINAFLDYLQSEGYYDLFTEIKIALGSDVAIAMCKEFVRSNDCDTAVRIYMSSQSDKSEYHPNPIDLIEDEEEKILLENLINSIKSLIPSQQKYEKIMTLIYIFIRNYDVLMKKYDTASKRLDAIKELEEKVLKYL